MTEDENAGEPPEVGSVAEEAAKLLGALQDWAAETGVHGVGKAGAAAADMAAGLRSVDAHIGHGTDCTWCPICRLVNAARHTNPEVREHLAVAVGSLAEAATIALRQGKTHRRTQESDSGPTRVDLDEDDGPPDDDRHD